MDGRRVYLTATQERLLLRLLEAPRQVVRWEALVAVVDNGRFDPPENAQVYWHLHHLRRKIGANHLLTVRGRGVLLR